MFHIREEGARFRNGFNFYPLDDKSSYGFVFVIRGPVNQRALWVRYSVHHAKWIIHYDKINHVEAARVMESWV